MQSMAHNEYVRSLDMVTTARKYMRHLIWHHSLDYICQKSVRIEEKWEKMKIKHILKSLKAK